MVMNDLTIAEPTAIDTIRSRIFTIRGIQVMLDRDLAELYGVPTKRLNEQVRRNAERFPDDFMFHLSKSEMSELVANCDRFKASLNFLGKRCFAFASLDKSNIPDILAKI